MKLLFLLWTAIRGAFDAAVQATAVWCILCYFSNVLWLQCFGIFLAIHFLSNLRSVNYLRTHTQQDCLIYVRRESALVGHSIIHGLVLAPLLTVAAILFLSLLQAWTNLETHWLHTLLFVACGIYNFSRMNGKRRMALIANARSAQRVPATQRVPAGPRPVRVIDI